MYVTSKKVEQPQFLKSAKFQNFTKQMDDTGVSANEEGKKIVPAGTVYYETITTTTGEGENVQTTTTKKAVGLTFHDIDVTYGPQPVAVMVEGYVIEDRLPAVVKAADKTTMTGIKFM